jgi:hypothetical protein
MVEAAEQLTMRTAAILMMCNKAAGLSPSKLSSSKWSKHSDALLTTISKEV